MDLAPAKVQRSSSSLPSAELAAPFKATERYIDLNTKENRIIALETCNNKIIISFASGQVSLYNSVNLQLETVLQYFCDRASANLLQCTCTEIIAAYSDGHILAWNIQSKRLMDIQGIP